MADDVDQGWTDRLVALEETLWRTATRFDQGWMERVLDPDFHEFGRSGRRWSRHEILSMPTGEITVAWPPQHLRVQLVAPGVALLTYVVVAADGEASTRSSLWVRERTGDGRPDVAADGARIGPDAGPRWRLRFHHGGPTTL